MEQGERVLLQPLLAYLRRRRRVRHDTLIVEELPWYGRRVDIAMLSRSRRTSAFELKLRNNGRAIEQASYNRLSFDRSYVVTATRPTDHNLKQARQSGVGMLVIDQPTQTVELILESPVRTVLPVVRARLLKKLRDYGEVLADVS